jgi:hypothetical protein
MLPLAGEGGCQGDSDTGSFLVGKVIITRRISLMADPEEQRTSGRF